MGIFTKGVQEGSWRAKVFQKKKKGGGEVGRPSVCVCGYVGPTSYGHVIMCMDQGL